VLARTLDGDAASETLELLANEVSSRRRDPYSAVEEGINTGVRSQNSEVRKENL